MTPLWALALLGAGALLVTGGAATLVRRARATRWGTLASVDVGGRGPTLRSPRYRLVGRPDELRRGRDGRRVPVEVKRRRVPARGPFPSHRIQLWAYCLLLEEADGRSPPFGVIRYADEDRVVPWDAAARSDLLAIRRAVAAPYDGRATPGPRRCAACRWVDRCDVHAALDGSG